VFLPTKSVKVRVEDGFLITEKGKYKMDILTYKEKIIAILPFVIIILILSILTSPLPNSKTGIITTLIGIVSGTLYGLFYPIGLLFLLTSLFFGYDYSYAVIYFFISFSIVAMILFWTKAKKVKKGVYVLIPPFRKV